jgi:hypothetical protein
MIVQMTIAEFKKILPKICGKDTSSDPGGWTTENLFWGQGAVVSLLAQSLFQGEILGVSLRDTKFADLKLHFWNQLPGRKEKDFTRSQFGKEFPKGLVVELVSLHSLLEGKKRLQRLKLLQERFEEECKKN